MHTCVFEQLISGPDQLIATTQLDLPVQGQQQTALGKLQCWTSNKQSVDVLHYATLEVKLMLHT